MKPTKKLEYSIETLMTLYPDLQDQKTLRGDKYRGVINTLIYHNACNYVIAVSKNQIAYNGEILQAIANFIDSSDFLLLNSSGKLDILRTTITTIIYE